MLNKYIKGASAERQLRKLFEGEGFVVIRSAKSGVDGVSPDLIALKSSSKIAVECKAHESGLYFSNEKFDIMMDWERRSGVPFYIAWKINRRDWRFFPLSVLKKNEDGYSLGLRDFDSGLGLEDVLSIKV